MFARLPIVASFVLSASIALTATPARAAINMYVDNVYQATYQTEAEAKQAAINWRSEGATPLCVYSNSGNKAPCPKSLGRKTRKISHRASGRIVDELPTQSKENGVNPPVTEGVPLSYGSGSR